MALAETTLSSAVAAGDKVINVASATSIVAGSLIEVDGERMKVQGGYSSGTEIPVLRGYDGTDVVAHVTSARVKHGVPSDWTAAPAGTGAQYAPGTRVRSIVSITATTATLTLPKPGEDLHVVLNGTNAITLTIPVPTKSLDLTELSIHANGVAQHILTFTGGLGGVGSGYTTITTASGSNTSYKFVALDETWRIYCQAPVSGTATKVQGAIA